MPSEETKQTVVLPAATVDFRYSGFSDRGAVRRLNEDSFLARFPLFVVADGMGGHAHGDRASQATIAAFLADIDGDGVASASRILASIRSANDAVIALSDENDGALSGTTLTGVALVELGGSDNYHWMAFNIGDSRTYRWDGRTLTQLSVDHSAVQELVDQGKLAKEDAPNHPHRNVVTRALGAEDVVDPDVWLVPARARQTFVLCSDGLTKELSDDEIARIIVFHDSEQLREADAPPISLAERLGRAAIAAGGSDNVTVVVVESEVVGVAGSGSAASDFAEETVDRVGLSTLLEDTRPRG